MATNYTSLLGFALPTTGELSGTWGDVVNQSITELVEDAIAGSSTADVTSADWTLTTTGSGAANQARNAILIPTGTPGVSRNIIAPSSSKAYIVANKSNGAVVVKGSATTGATVVAGTTALVAWDGSDFVLVAQNLANAQGTLVVAKGGTGATTLTGYVKGSGTSALTASATIPNTDITGLGTMSTQNANNVAVTGGNINGTTIGGTTPAAGTFTTATATTGNITTVNSTTTNATTVDATNVEVTNLKAKDGTAAATIADSTGIITVSTQLNVDNININGNTVSSTNTNGNIIFDPNGTGAVQEVVGSTAFNIVSQTDVGTAPNEIPLNQYLGVMAYIDYPDFTRPFLVANLPAAGVIGRFAHVTDGDAGLAWGDTVTNSGSPAGATPYLVWDNGTNWTVAGK